MNRMFKLSVTIITLCCVLTGCSVNPVTGATEFSLVSPEKEVAIGTSHYAPSQQSQGGRYYIDPDLQVYINEIGRKLAAVSGRPNLPYEFVVLNNSTPNAWALPGGKIAINRGLLLHLNDEAELAAVIGHEIVHAAARHSAAQMTRGTFIGLGAAAVGALGSNYGLGEVGRPDWMESDSSDDGKLMNNRNNFDLGRPPSCKHILQSFVSKWYSLTDLLKCTKEF